MLSGATVDLNAARRDSAVGWEGLLALPLRCLAADMAVMTQDVNTSAAGPPRTMAASATASAHWTAAL